MRSSVWATYLVLTWISPVAITFNFTKKTAVACGRPALRYTLFLVKWYPGPADPLNGDFVQRHAEALTRQEPVAVVHIVADPRPGARWWCLHESVPNGVRTLQGYYRHRPTGLGWLDAALKPLLYAYGTYRAVGWVRRTWGRPVRLHAHVLLRPALAAWVAHRLWGVPYFITEHWSGFLDGGYARQPRAKRWLTRQLVQRAAGLSAVSERLRAAMAAQGLAHPASRVIPNVVETTRFVPSPLPAGPPVFLHVSALQPVKNVPGLLRAFAQLHHTHPAAQLDVVGDGPARPDLERLAAQLGIADRVRFRGVLMGEMLVDAYRRCTATVLFSHSETFGCVLIESLASGRPVVATRAGAMPEIVTPAVGLLVPPGDEAALTAALRTLADAPAHHDPEALHQWAAARYGYAAVAQQWADWYGAKPLLLSAS